MPTPARLRVIRPPPQVTAQLPISPFYARSIAY
jgi:hypothetical protein